MKNKMMHCWQKVKFNLWPSFKVLFHKHLVILLSVVCCALVGLIYVNVKSDFWCNVFTEMIGVCFTVSIVDVFYNAKQKNTLKAINLQTLMELQSLARQLHVIVFESKNIEDRTADVFRCKTRDLYSLYVDECKQSDVVRKIWEPKLYDISHKVDQIDKVVKEIKPFANPKLTTVVKEMRELLILTKAKGFSKPYIMGMVIRLYRKIKRYIDLIDKYEIATIL